MRKSWWQSVRALLVGKTRRRLRRSTRPVVEALEDRRLMTQRVWDGGSLLNTKWSNAKNWAGDVAPIPGDALVFPAGIVAPLRSTNNDFPSLTSFTSIIFHGGDFKLAGNRVLLSGNITSNPTDNISKLNEIRLDITFSAGSHTVSVNGVRLDLSGSIANEVGKGQLTYAGTSAGGRISLLGTAANTYDQPTIVSSAITVSAVAFDKFSVDLNKDNNVPAISGELTVRGRGLLDTQGVDGGFREGQLKQNLKVRVDDLAFCDLHRETIGKLTMSGGNLFVLGSSADPGEVTLTDDISCSSFSTIATTDGSLRLASTTTVTRNIDVASGAILFLACRITSGDLRKLGPGKLTFLGQDGASSYGRLTIAAGTARIDVGGDGSINVPNDIVVGEEGGTPATATIDQDAGNNVIPNAASIRVASTGTLNLNGATETIGSLTVNGGNVALKAGDNLRITGLATFNGGLVKNDGGKLELQGGLTMVAGTLETPSGDTILRGGLATTAAETSATINGTLELTDGTHLVNIADGGADKDLIINAVIQDAAGATASVAKAGPGKVELKGNNTYTGITTVGDGILLVNGVNAANQGPYFAGGGQLRGVGTISELNVNGGIVSPGDGSGGLLRVLGSTTFGGQYVAHLDGTSVPAFDQIRTNTLAFSDPVRGRLRSVLDPKVGFAAPVGQNFRLIDVTGPARLAEDELFHTVDGTVLTQGATFTADGQNFTINYTGGDGNDVVITRNTGPAFANRQITPVITEGQTAFITGHVTEPNHQDTFFLDVDWGDGKRQTFTFPPGSSKDIKVGHRYLDDPAGTDDTYDVQLHWRDQFGGGNSAELETVVHNKAPILGAITASLPPFTVGQPITISSSVTDMPLDTFKVHVRWDVNGPWQAINLPAGTKFFQLKHTYAKAGDHHVTILLIDDDLDVDEVSFLLKVAE